jgi:uncharacterized glyoxalase superfamily protein PhnB
MNPSNPNKLFPLFVTTKLAETKHFYTQVLGFETSVDQPYYLQLTSQGKDGPELCFMIPDAFKDSGVQPAFRGEGVIVSIPTKDADARHASLIAAGVTPLTTPSNKPWGWRSFLVRDPNGVILDFFHVVDEKSM